MGEKYMIALKFSGAKRFMNVESIGGHKLSHTICEYGNINRKATIADRTICPDDTLPLHCVANAIAVLCGDRPVPFKRKHSPLADYPEFAHYVDMAKRARVRMDSVVAFNTVDKKGEPKRIENTSVMQVAKFGMYEYNEDGTRKISVKQQKTTAKLNIDGVDHDLVRSCATHDSIGAIWPRETYLAFDAMCMIVLGKDYKSRLNVLQTLSELRKLYLKKDERVVEFMAGLPKSTVLRNDLLEPVVNGSVSGQIFRGENNAYAAELKSWGSPVSVHGKPELTWVLSGMIYLEVTADEAEAILGGPEVATLLDGGVLYPVDSNENIYFGSLREVVTRWDETKSKLPSPYVA